MISSLAKSENLSKSKTGSFKFLCNLFKFQTFQVLQQPEHTNSVQYTTITCFGTDASNWSFIYFTQWEMHDGILKKDKPHRVYKALCFLIILEAWHIIYNRETCFAHVTEWMCVSEFCSVSWKLLYPHFLMEHCIN